MNKTVGWIIGGLVALVAAFLVFTGLNNNSKKASTSSTSTSKSVSSSKKASSKAASSKKASSSTAAKGDDLETTNKGTWTSADTKKLVYWVPANNTPTDTPTITAYDKLVEEFGQPNDVSGGTPGTDDKYTATWNNAAKDVKSGYVKLNFQRFTDGKYYLVK